MLHVFLVVLYVECIMRSVAVCDNVMSSCEAEGRPAGKGISRHLWNLKVHDRVHKTSLLDPVLGHVNPFHTLKSCFVYIYINTVLP
jgi:hypothetical protein